VISRELIDDTQSRNFKEAAKYLPLVFFQEMQGPEVLRPESRGMQGSNMQNDRKDGMGFAVTTPSALEEYEQIEVVDGLGGPMYGPTNPSGLFNFITKRPTEGPLREVELAYESSTVGTIHVDLGTASARTSSAIAPTSCWPTEQAMSPRANFGANWLRWRIREPASGNRSVDPREKLLVPATRVGCAAWAGDPGEYADSNRPCYAGCVGNNDSEEGSQPGRCGQVPPAALRSHGNCAAQREWAHAYFSRACQSR